MLVGADAVEARARRVEQLVQRPVVVLAHAPGVGQLPPRGSYPHARVALLEVGGQFAVRHQVKRADLHLPSSGVIRSLADAARRFGMTPRAAEEVKPGTGRAIGGLGRPEPWTRARDRGGPRVSRGRTSDGGHGGRPEPWTRA